MILIASIISPRQDEEEHCMVTMREHGTTGRRTIVGVFERGGEAEAALDQLRLAGVQPDQVSIISRDTGEARAVADNTGMGAEGTMTGAVLGGVTGGVLGWLVGAGALAIPGIGPIVAAGALATTLSGAAVGAAAGGLVGALVDLGIPEEDATTYQSSVEQGHLLVTVAANGDAQAHQARVIMEQNGAGRLNAYGVTDASASREAPKDDDRVVEPRPERPDEVRTTPETTAPTNPDAGYQTPVAGDEPAR
jgi:hypothetical protein